MLARDSEELRVALLNVHPFPPGSPFLPGRADSADVLYWKWTNRMPSENFRLLPLRGVPLAESDLDLNRRVFKENS